MSEREPVRDNVFISYSHQDKKWLQRVESMLQPLVSKGKIITWVDRKDIRPGDPWDDEIKKALAAAKIAVLLVSEHFLASEYITKVELPAILEAAKKKECTLFWILIRECLYEEYGLKDFHAAHDIKQPLQDLKPSNVNKVLTGIAREISQVYTKQAPIASAVKSKQIKILSITASPDDVDGADDIFYEQEKNKGQANFSNEIRGDFFPNP